MILFLLLVTGLFYWYYRWLTSQFGMIHSSDEQVLENTVFSTQAFYQLVEEALEQKQIPGLKRRRIFYSMGGLFASKREYLRITYKGYVFDICAAPFVHDFFVSWQQGRLQQLSFLRRRAKSFYEQDTEAIFLSTVKLCVGRAVTHMSEIKVQRGNAFSTPGG